MTQNQPSTDTDTALRIRRADSSDAPLIGEFLHGIMLDHDEAPPAGSALVDAAQRILGLDHAYFLICEATSEASGAGAPVGMVQVTERFSTWRVRPFLYLDDFYVRPAWRSRGVGQALFAEVKRRAAAINCVRIDLDVYGGNERAYRFYLREGFVDTGESLMRYSLD